MKLPDTLTVTVLPPGAGVAFFEDHVKEYRPVQVFILPEGAIDDKPSITLVMIHPDGSTAFGQLSFAMMEPMLQAIEDVKNRANLSRSNVVELVIAAFLEQLSISPDVYGDEELVGIEEGKVAARAAFITATQPESPRYGGDI